MTGVYSLFPPFLTLHHSVEFSTTMSENGCLGKGVLMFPSNRHLDSSFSPILKVTKHVTVMTFESQTVLLSRLFENDLATISFQSSLDPTFQGFLGFLLGWWRTDLVSADSCLKMSSLRMSVNILLADDKSCVRKTMELHSRKHNPLPQTCLQACSLAKQVWLVRNPQAFLQHNLFLKALLSP